MSNIEAQRERVDLKNSVLRIVSLEKPFTDPEKIVAYPHLAAWLETFGEINVAVPRDVLLLYSESPYRKAEVEATRREAGLVALSSLIIASKLGIPTENEFGQPISDKMSRIIAGKKVVEDEKLDKDEVIGRTEAATFIQDGLGFLTAVDRLRSYPDSFPLRRLIRKYFFDKKSDDFFDDDHNLSSLIKNNNIGLSGGLALFGLALPKSSFVDNCARSRFGQIVSVDPAAQCIYKSLKDVVFDGRSTSIDAEIAELAGGEQFLPSVSILNLFEYSDGHKSSDTNRTKKPQGPRAFLEEVTDQFLARH